MKATTDRAEENPYSADGDEIQENLGWLVDAILAGSTIPTQRRRAPLWTALIDSFKHVASGNYTVDQLTDVLTFNSLAKALHRSGRFGQQLLRDRRDDLFRGADVSLLTANRRTEERDTVWEAFVAAVFAGGGLDAELHEPEDVRTQMEGLAVGASCKHFYGDPANDEAERVPRRVERIIEGGRQLDRSEVAWGIVVVNLTSILAQSDFATGGFVVPDATTRVEGATELKRRADIIVDRWAEALARNRARLGSKCRAVLYYAQGVTFVDGEPILLSYGRTQPVDGSDSPAGSYIRVFQDSIDALGRYRILQS